MSGRHCPEENSLLTKHVVAAGRSAKDPGSTPGASSLRSELCDERRLPRRSPSSGVGGRRSPFHPRSELRLGKPVLFVILSLLPYYSAASMRFSYVYILQSQSCQEHFYVGLTDDLKDRLRRHNSGEVPHTSKFGSWEIKTAVASATGTAQPNLKGTSKLPRAGHLRRNACNSSFRAWRPTKTAAPRPSHGRRAT